jgi:sec-independent protein translocase protein TatA
MPIRFGPTELIIILVIVLLLFGPGRIARIAGELGKGIRSFKDSVSSDEMDESEDADEKKDSS